MRIGLVKIIITLFIVLTIASIAFMTLPEKQKSEIKAVLPTSYANSVENLDILNLTDNQIMVINDTHYVQRNKVFLHDNSMLIIQNSLFEHKHDYSFQHILEAYDNSRIIVNNSEITSSDWLNWNFYGNSTLVLDNVKQHKSNIWHWFPENSSAFAYNSRLRATVDDGSSFYIENGTDVFIELVWKGKNVVVDESLPEEADFYKFPNDSEENVTMSLIMKNTKTSGWGITVVPTSNVTIRDAKSLVVTFSFGAPWEGRTVNLENLKATYYDDEEWRLFDDTSLRLVNVTTERWSPIVGNNNTLIMKNSELADNAFNWGDGRVVIQDSTAYFVRARNDVQIKVINSRIFGDVVAQDNGIITLVNTKVDGKIVEEDNGRIIIDDG